MSHSDCTFIPSCSPITSHSAQSFHPVHPSLHTLHSHSILFTHHFTLCTVIPSCSPITSHSAQSFHPVHPPLHTLHSRPNLHCSPITSHSAQPFHPVHPSFHILHSHFNLHCSPIILHSAHSTLHCSPITSHSAQSFQSALFTHHFTLCTVIPVCIVHPSLHTLHTCGPQPEAFCFSMPSQFYIHSENNFNSVDYIQVKHR